MLRKLKFLLATGLAAGLLTACSSSPSPSASSKGSVSTACSPPTHWRQVAASLASTQPNAGQISDYVLRSFDGSSIRVHWFPNAKASKSNPLPTVLMGPGWGSGGDTKVASTGLLGATSIGNLQDAGFNVLTWDPRGFGLSGGTIEVDSPNFEAKDVSAIISWLAQRDGVQVDGPGNPRMGMVGGSYGGGIQFVTAARDCRVDAIAPAIAWNSLVSSLSKSSDPKSGWSGILSAVSTGRKIDAHVSTAQKSQLATGTVSPADTAFFASRGPSPQLKQVHIPTLILQGTVDGLFTLSEGIANYEQLRSQGNTVAMAWFCGGHGMCLTPPGAVNPGTLSVDWMRHYVAGETQVKVATGLTFVDQQGASFHATAWPLSSAGIFKALGAGTLPLVAGGGSLAPSPKNQSASAKSVVDSVALAVTPGPATRAVNVALNFKRNGLAAGVPRLHLSYEGARQSGATRPTRVYAQLVDPSTGLVLGNQVTPIVLTLDGKRHQITLPLEAVVFSAKAGSKVILQITPSSNAYAPGQFGGSVNFAKIQIELPLVSGVVKL